MIKKFEIIVMIFLIIFIKISLNCQTKIDFSQKLDFKNSIRIDSIFEYFKYPTLPENIKFPNNIEWQNLFVAAMVNVDTNNRVKELHLYRLYEFKKDTLVEKQIWYVIKNCIIKSSKEWVFKDVKWKIPSFKPPDKKLVEYFKQSNLSKREMPFSGQQFHLMIFHFVNDISGDDIPFIYQIRVE